MSHQSLRDQRGVAMLLELVLVAAVLALVGVALYQSNHHSTNTAALVNQPKLSASTMADTAAKAAEQDATNEAALSATAEASVDDVTAIDTDVTNLGGAFDDSSF